MSLDLGRSRNGSAKKGVYIPPTVLQVHQMQERLTRDYGRRAKDIPAVLQELDFVLEGMGYYEDRSFNAIVRLTLYNRPVNGTQPFY